MISVRAIISIFFVTLVIVAAKPGHKKQPGGSYAFPRLPSCKKNVIIVADGSVSINFEKIKKFSKFVVDSLDVGNQFAFVQYSSRITVEVGLTTFTVEADRADILKTIAKIPHQKGRAKKCKQALEFLSETMMGSVSSDAVTVVIMLTNGASYDANPTAAAEKLRQLYNVQLFAVGISLETTSVHLEVAREQLLSMAGRQEHLIEALTYDSLNIQLSTRILSLACSDAPVITTTTTLKPQPIDLVETTTAAAKAIETTAAPVPEQKGNDCDQLPEGNYVLGPCETKYYTCVAGDRLLQKCPGVLVYDQSSDQCVRKEESIGCGATPSTRPPSTPTTPPPVTLPKVDFDCSDKKDGSYANPKATNQCDKFFYTCSVSGAYKEPCPSGLFYDPETKLCDLFANIPICSGQSRVPTTTTQKPVPTEKPAFDCSNKENGAYESKPACSGRYFECSVGQTVTRVCPADLYFDIETQLCDYKWNVKSCGGQRTTPSKVPTISTTQPPTLPPVDFDCTNKQDGYYADPKNKCTGIYYACTAESARLIRCPEPLVYEPEMQTCERREESYGCTGTRRTTVPTTPRRPPPVPISLFIDCSKLADGFYADPIKKCAKYFYACVGGEGRRMECPGGETYFNVKTGSCELFNDVLECGGGKPLKTKKPIRRPTTTPYPTVVPVPFDCSRLTNGQYADPTQKKCAKYMFVCSNGAAYKQMCPHGLYFDDKYKICTDYDQVFDCTGKLPKSTTPAPTRTTQKPEFDCSSKPDGAYAPLSNKCSKYYFQCSNGFSFKIDCPRGLYFDIANFRCDRFAYVFACSGKAPPTPRSIVPTTTPIPVTREKLPIDCASLPNGDYVNPENKCSIVYYTCTNNLGYRRQCPFETYFDPEGGICELKENVPVCGGKAPANTTTGKPVPTPRLPFKCADNEDGNYAAGKCEKYYYSCVGGRTSRTDCPANLFYDTEYDECEYKQNIPDCGGKRPEPEKVTTITTSAPPPQNRDFDCTKYADGSYAHPRRLCSRSYFVCDGGVTSSMNCPSGLYFDAKKTRCDFRYRISACGKVTITTIAAVQQTTLVPAAETTTPLILPASTTILPSVPTTVVAPAESTPIQLSTSTVAPPAPTTTSTAPIPETTIVQSASSSTSALFQESTVRLESSTSTVASPAPTTASSIPVQQTTTVINTSAPTVAAPAVTTAALKSTLITGASQTIVPVNLETQTPLALQYGGDGDIIE